MKSLLNRLMVSIALVVLVSTSAQAETIELTDGKILRGSIESMDTKQVIFKSDDKQAKTISRDRIARITFVDSPELDRPGISLATMLRELRAEGIDEEAWTDLKKRIRVMETPELKRYFDDTIAGLKDDMQRLRKDAMAFEDEILEFRKEFGPQADTLNDYLIALRNVFAPTESTNGNMSVEVDIDGKSSNNAPRSVPNDKARIEMEVIK